MKVFICELCKVRKKPYHFTRKGFREHLKQEHFIVKELTKTNLWHSEDFDKEWQKSKGEK